MLIGIGIGLSFGHNPEGSGTPSAITSLTSLIASLGGVLWVAGQQCFVDSAGTIPAINGDTIGRIGDLCGSNYAWQDTDANKPTLGVDEDGKSVLTFDGSNDFLRTAITTPIAGYVAGVWTATTDGVARGMLSSSNQAAVAGARLNKSATTDRATVNRLDGVSNTAAQSTTVLGSAKYVVDGHYDADSGSVRVNGAAENTISGTRVATSTNYFRLGAEGSGGNNQVNHWLGTMLAQIWIPGARPGTTVEAQIRTLLAELTAVTGVV